MDFTQYVLLGTVITGANEFLKRLRAKDYWTAATIVTSALIGLLFGFLEVEGLEPVTGLAAGVGVSGAVTLLSYLGGTKSTPTKHTDIIEK